MATLITLASFDGEDGSTPSSGLIADANGDLYGTTTFGGADGIPGQTDVGTVFEVAKTAVGYGSTPTVLVSFDDSDGAFPQSGLFADAEGDLFGTTDGGGSGGSGTVFELVPSSDGYSLDEASFNGASGAGSFSGLISDAQGNLFGTILQGGPDNAGAVFEIARTASGYDLTPTVLARFDGTDGESPYGNLLADAAGNLFGTTYIGGANNGGTVFEIARTADGYASTPTVLASFDSTSGGLPEGTLVADANGDLFGTTTGGVLSVGGTVFEIAKTANGFASTPTVLVSFDGTNGSNPYGGLIVDANGDLFGTTQKGGANNDGAVFEIAKTVSGYSSTPTLLVNFDGTDGDSPDGTLIADADGDLFGTTTGTGLGGDDGTVFEITGSGYEAACFLPGTLIGTPAGDVPIETLRIGDLVSLVAGGSAPVRWVARQTVASRFADPMRAWPVRVRAGALAAGVPARDLLLSPDHALFLHGVLVQAGALVNGASIVRERAMPERFTYYNLELATHALIQAEGMAAETFVDNIGRGVFDNAAEHAALYPDAPWIDELGLPRAKSARQVPQALRRRLLARAGMVGAPSAAEAA